MFASFRQKIRYVYVLIDIVLIACTFATTCWLRFGGFDFSFSREYAYAFCAWGILLVGFLKSRDLYVTNRELTIPQEIVATAKAVFYPSMIIAAAIFCFKFNFFSRHLFGENFVILILLLSMWRAVKRLLVRRRIVRGYNNFNTLIVGTGRVARILYESIRSKPFLGFKIIGFIDTSDAEVDLPVPILGDIKDIERICKTHFIDEIFITNPTVPGVVADSLRMVQKTHVGIRVIPDVFQSAGTLARSGSIGLLPVLTYKDMQLRAPAGLAVKRVFDVVLAGIVIVACIPLFIIIAVIIKLDSPGRILYTQKRVGEKGTSFHIYKFRSMVENADTLQASLKQKNEVAGGAIFKIKKDPRITKVGRFLRRYSLDELPQLFNILFGTMSFVGPRPFPAYEVEKIGYKHIPRLNIKPGLTGLAQVKGRSDLSFDRWMRWDLWYLNNWSLELDIRILLSTIPAVLKGKGAY